MLFTCSTAVAAKKMGKMKHYYVVPGHGNDEVAPDRRDLELFKSGVLTAKGFALNYEVKLRSREAYEWMARVSAEASHEDVVLVGDDEGAENSVEKSYRAMLAEMMLSMFGGTVKLRCEGELK
jgi:glyoxylase-like metal-dependent hydrolase (beta-lactamase superfamily II)